MSRPSHSRRWVLPAVCFALIATGAFSAAARGQDEAGSSGAGQHLRALAVYEYLGSYKKPARSRLVPVAVWDGSEFEPGGLYLADPVPLTVESGTLYELMKDGDGVGQVEVMRAEQVGSGELAGERASAWIGLGKYLPNPPSGPKFKVPASLTAKATFASDTPHFAYKPPATTGVAGGKASSGGGGPAREGAGAESGRPTLHRRESGSAPQSASPKLHRRSEAQQLGSRAAPPSGRPILTYGKSAPSPVASLRKDVLKGLPSQMKQMAAISDAEGTTDHSYAWDWASPGDRTAALHKLEALARQSLAAREPGATAGNRAKSGVKSARKFAKLRAGHERAVKTEQTSSAARFSLTHERFHAFELDWGSGPVYVYSARAGAPGETTTYITVIAKPDFAGGLIPLYRSVTPENLLDYQPRMKLIDAVDATGGGRGDLLFDLIMRSGRQFALFRVEGGQAEEVFHSGPR